MSELATNLRSYAVKYANDYGYCVASDLNKAADRIEALEFEVEHERYNVEKTAQEAAKRIKALEAALQAQREDAGRYMTDIVAAANKDAATANARIEALEAALRHASSHLADLEYHYHGDREAMWKPIRAALAPEQDKCSTLWKRLREQTAFNPYNTQLAEAADRIEALEAALRLTRPYIEMHTLSPSGTMRQLYSPKSTPPLTPKSND